MQAHMETRCRHTWRPDAGQMSFLNGFFIILCVLSILPKIHGSQKSASSAKNPCAARLAHKSDLVEGSSGAVILEKILICRF